MVTQYILLSIYVLRILSNLGFSIANAYASNQSSDAKDECSGAIWYCVTALGPLNILAFINGVHTLRLMYQKKEPENNLYFTVICIGISIWACVNYFAAPDDCADYFRTNRSVLWKMLLANVLHFFVNIIIAGVMLVLQCFGCAEEKNEEQQPLQNSLRDNV